MKTLWPYLIAAAVAVTLVVRWVDLTPRVETDFFFSPDDPQYVASAAIAERFPAGQQLIVRIAAPDIRAPRYAERVRELGDAIGELDGVTGVTSVANQDAFESPLWNRVLVSPDEGATSMVVNIRVAPDSTARFVEAIETVTAEWSAEDFQLVISGVPYVIELIRRNLSRDLAVFSSVAFLTFGVIVALIYRSWPVVLGTLVACLTASALTLGVTQLVGGSIGLLTANIATIVFVLTLSHIVFLTSNWKAERQSGSAVAGDEVRRAVRATLPASFWCMMTTLLGFASLFLASAKPLRELGMAGAIGTAVSIVVAYVFFPPFLRGAAATPEPRSSTRNALGVFQRGHLALVAFLVLVVGAGFGVPRLTTDPNLLSYFAVGDPLREGLEAVDRDGGSSPLNIVVADSAGARIDAQDVVARMWDAQLALETDASVGSVISPALLLEEAKRTPFIGALPPAQLLDFLQLTPMRSTMSGYIHPDRDQGLFFLRMRESGRVEPREAVIARIRDQFTSRDLSPVLIGGLYEQQDQLGKLIASSLVRGLGGLVVLFLGIAYFVSRDTRVTVAMVFSLAGIPILVLGTLGHLGRSIDIISSPAANVALAMGVDSMIHLMMRARRYRLAGRSGVEAWTAAQQELWRPIVGAALIISAGFGIFSLSTFPPTQQFGLAVILGTVAAAATALLVLPQAAALAFQRAPTANPPAE